MKSKLLNSCLAVGVLCSQASTPLLAKSIPHNPKSGLRIGAAMGASDLRTRMDFHEIDNGATASSSGKSARSNGLVGGLFIGWDQYFDNLYTGVEADWNYNTAEPQALLQTFDDPPLGTDKIHGRLRHRHDFGLKFMLGHKFESFTGYVLGQVRMGIFDASLKMNIADPNNDDRTRTHTHHKLGYGFGFGAKKHFDLFEVGIEASHTFYGKLNEKDCDQDNRAGEKTNFKVKNIQESKVLFKVSIPLV